MKNKCCLFEKLFKKKIRMTFTFLVNEKTKTKIDIPKRKMPFVFFFLICPPSIKGGTYCKAVQLNLLSLTLTYYTKCKICHTHACSFYFSELFLIWISPFLLFCTKFW